MPDAENDAGWTPGRWWQVLAPDGSLWCETSDEDEAREAVRPGDTLRRLHERNQQEWRVLPPAKCDNCGSPITTYDPDCCHVAGCHECVLPPGEGRP